MAALASRSPDGVSKLAVRRLAIAFADELAADGIRVNAIAPGLQATENAMADLPAATVDHIVESVQLIHRIGTVEDVVAAMVYLCSAHASFVTGVTLPVTGGALLSI